MEVMDRVVGSLLLWIFLFTGCASPGGGRQEALSALEKTAELDRSGVNIVDPDILAPALSYIPSHGNDEEKMMLWYYLGRIQFNQGALVDAAVSFERAGEWAEKAGNQHFVGLVNRSMAGIFNWTMNVREDSLHLRRAVNAFDAAGDTLHSAEAGLRLAVAYYNDRKWDKAYAQFMKIRPSAMKNEMLAFRYRLCLGSFLLDAPRDYGVKDALGLFEDALAFNPVLPMEKCIDYGYALTLAGREREALPLWDSLERTHPEGLLQLDYRRYCYLKAHGRTAEAMPYLERSARLQDSVLRIQTSEMVSRSQRNHMEAVAREERSEAERERDLHRGMMAVVSLVLVLLVLASVVLIQKERGKRLESQQTLEDTRRLVARLEEAEKRYLTKIHTLSRDVRNTRSALETARSEYLYLFRSSYRKLGELFEAKYYAKSDVSLSKKVGDILKGIDGGQDGNLQLLRFIEDKLDRPVTRLREDIPDLKDDEMWLFCYLVIGYDASLISLLMDVGSINTVYSRKKRLLERIKRLPPARAKRYLDLID